ncbi:trimeric intracellular cation channel family protein [Myxococcus sp. AS-1-15]|uniref:trimeric intracellular cation channel family protein n=1 Tax=Myxococcus sp. AS-1-15 TaxID=2874600 RepID=UPI001CBBCED8|nr:TRIC cation channel family protein [Myxococcus sp. AS-1-15]
MRPASMEMSPSRRMSRTLLTAGDLAGTFVFAVEGGLTAARAGLDVLGILVLAFATALGGGMVRDVLLGAVPPLALQDWRYAATAFGGGALVMLMSGPLGHVPVTPLLILDAAGLALFTVTGAGKALSLKATPLAAMLLGAITGAGGGTIRDVLLARVPLVLRADVYAVAALLGAGALLLARRLGASAVLAASVGAAVCFGLRTLAVLFHWKLPGILPQP